MLFRSNFCPYKKAGILANAEENRRQGSNFARTKVEKNSEATKEKGKREKISFNVTLRLIKLKS